jgi:hypothetical protein
VGLAFDAKGTFSFADPVYRQIKRLAADALEAREGG